MEPEISKYVLVGREPLTRNNSPKSRFWIICAFRVVLSPCIPLIQLNKLRHRLMQHFTKVWGEWRAVSCLMQGCLCRDFQGKQSKDASSFAIISFYKALPCVRNYTFHRRNMPPETRKLITFANYSNPSYQSFGIYRNHSLFHTTIR